MKISDMVQRLSEREDTQVSRKEMLGWLNDVSPERDLLKVDKIQVGDTFWHKLVGGKNRPWVVLWVRKGFVGAATLTHSNLEAGFSCEDRFWSGCFIGPTTSIFSVDRVKDSVYFPYTNKKHLSEIRKEISDRWK